VRRVALREIFFMDMVLPFVVWRGGALPCASTSKSSAVGWAEEMTPKVLSVSL